MGVPTFLLRKLYKRGSLRETADGRFAFALRNALATATITSPPRIVVNGIAHAPDSIDAGSLDLAGITEEHPFRFTKGKEVLLHFPGQLLRGGNRIHITVDTREFGRLDWLVEDREAEYCDLPDRGTGRAGGDSEE